MMSNKYDLACVLIGLVTSTWFTETIEKVLMTSLAMVVGTTIAFFWRRFLHKKFKNVMRNKNNKQEKLNN